MYSGPHTHTDGLVFGYDTGYGIPSITESRFFKGAPMTNYASLDAYSIYNSGATNYRNQTFPPPPTSGYEVVKVVADTFGSYGQSILWNAGYPNNNVATITNSVYAWLESGTYVQVGQHWWPWYYGAAQYIEKGKWVRIKETYTINEGNSYGSAALVYSTDGVAYFSMPQFEYNSFGTPFAIFGSRDPVDSLVDLKRSTTIDVSNVSFNSSGAPYFDGTNDYINVPTSVFPAMNQITIELVNYGIDARNSSVIAGGIGGNQDLNIHLPWGDGNIYWDVGRPFNRVYQAAGSSYIGWHHWVFTKNPSTGIMNIYRDGVLWAQNTGQTSSIISLSGGTVSIGRYSNGSTNAYYHNGTVPVLKVYNTELTAQEVYNNYLAYKGRFGI